MCNALINALTEAARPCLQDSLKRADELCAAERPRPTRDTLLQLLGVPATEYTPSPRRDSERGRQLLRQLADAALTDVAVELVRAIAADADARAESWDVSPASIQRVLGRLDADTVAREVGLDPAPVRLSLQAMGAHLLAMVAQRPQQLTIDDRTIELRPECSAGPNPAGATVARRTAWRWRGRR